MISWKIFYQFHLPQIMAQHHRNHTNSFPWSLKSSWNKPLHRVNSVLAQRSLMIFSKILKIYCRKCHENKVTHRIQFNWSDFHPTVILKSTFILTPTAVRGGPDGIRIVDRKPLSTCNASSRSQIHLGFSEDVLGYSVSTCVTKIFTFMLQFIFKESV